MISDVIMFESGMREDIGQRVSEIRGDTVEEQRFVYLYAHSKDQCYSDNPGIQLLSWTWSQSEYKPLI